MMNKNTNQLSKQTEKCISKHTIGIMEGNDGVPMMVDIELLAVAAAAAVVLVIPGAV